VSRPLHRGAEVATVPDVRRGAQWRDTTMPATPPPRYRRSKRGTSPPNVRKSTLLAALSLPHGMGDERTCRIETLRVTTKLGARGAGERLDVFRDRFARRFPINSFSVTTGEGLESVRAATYHSYGANRVGPALSGGLTDQARPLTYPVGTTSLDLTGRDPARLRPFPDRCPESGQRRFRWSERQAPSRFR
jgi:hypothetical protein